MDVRLGDRVPRGDVVRVLLQATCGGEGVNVGAATTRALAATTTPVLAALLAQRYMVLALSLGAVKG